MSTIKKRHVCYLCGSKKVEDKMRTVVSSRYYYKKHWVCLKCPYSPSAEPGSFDIQVDLKSVHTSLESDLLSFGLQDLKSVHIPLDLQNLNVGLNLPVHLKFCIHDDYVLRYLNQYNGVPHGQFSGMYWVCYFNS